MDSFHSHIPMPGEWQHYLLVAVLYEGTLMRNKAFLWGEIKHFLEGGGLL